MQSTRNWEKSNPCLLHSDQGFQYTNKQYHKKSETLNVTVSHSRKGNYYDNSPCENFFSHFKSEALGLHILYDSISDSFF